MDGNYKLMKRKINLLIGFSAVMLLALSAVQYYLVKTAYDYKIEQFHSEIKEKISRITNDYSDIDATIFNKKDQLYKQLAEQYIYDKKARIMIKSALLQNKFKAALTKKLHQRLSREFPDLKLDFAIVLNKFVLYDNLKPADTIYAEKPAISNKLYGNLASLDGAFLVRNYVGTTSGMAQGLNPGYKLLTEETLYVSVQNWETIILKRMAAVLLFALFSILTLVTLFILALKALIRQKKVSDVKTDFINNITHELKTPLTTLSVSAKMLQREEIRRDEKSYHAILETINRQNNRLQQLIDQVLEHSLGYAEIELQQEKTAANAFLKTILSDFRLTHPGITIAMDFEPLETVLQLDKFHLATAIENVLENAVKYGCKKITVATALKNGQFQISIQDDGIGIGKQNHANLFDKFYRVPQGNLHNTKGLGLGLYYVDQIVKAHRGSVKVISELGKGAAFEINLPQTA